MPELIKPNGMDKNKPIVSPVVEDTKKKLTAEQELRAENFKLKQRILQLQVQLNDVSARLLSAQLNQEKIQLDQELGKDWMK